MRRRKLGNLLKNKKREITLVLVSMMVLGLFFSGSSMGKQFSSINIQTSGKIAEPVLVIDDGPIVEVNGKRKNETYHFKVKNYKENGEVTQIDLWYYIEILFASDEAISFKLYQDNQEIRFENNKTPNRMLKKELAQEDDYLLEIIYDKAKNHSSEEILQEVQIKVHAEQLQG